jgi:hypothetical protein
MLKINNLHLKYNVYPTQAIVSAYAIILSFDTLEEAAKDTGRGYCAAEGCADVPGAGGIASRVIDALRHYKESIKRNQYVALMQLIAELQHQWISLCGPKSGNFEKNFLEGLTKAVELEREFAVLLSEKKTFFEGELEICSEKVDTAKLIETF